MSEHDEVIIERDPQAGQAEESIEIPMERINPADTLRKMIEEFVTREWSELADSECTLVEKIEQVMRQLMDKRAKITFDYVSETWNIIPSR